jgi:hypothetical protein
MYAVIGRVEIKPGYEEETAVMIRDMGVPMFRGMTGSVRAYWARTAPPDLTQHSFWVFDTEENARSAEAVFKTLRDMPEAPATFVSVDVCQVLGEA